MWLLIEVNKQEDAGKNEERRILVEDVPTFDKIFNIRKKIILIGTEVHPMTGR